MTRTTRGGGALTSRRAGREAEGTQREGPAPEPRWKRPCPPGTVRSGGLGDFDTLLRLAIRAQNACRASLESLSFLQNPRTVSFVRQANIASGPQQVNNGIPPPSRAGQLGPSSPTQLLEAHDVERLDTRASGPAVEGDSPVEAVALVDGPENGNGQKEVSAPRVQGRRTRRAAQARAIAPPGKANGRGEALDA